MAEEETVKENEGGIGNIIVKILPYILMIALGALGGIYTAQQKPEWFGLSKGTAAAQAEVNATIAKVGKLIALPTDEQPTVATVTDASKVKDQPFFADAENGDVVLIYTKAQKAILYRPSSNIIVEVGAVNLNNSQAVASPSPSATPSGKTKVKATPAESPVESPSPTP
jgi:hypothetical protein